MNMLMTTLGFLPSCTNVVDVETNTTGRLTDHGAVLERLVDTLYRVVLHADEEA